MHSVSEIPMNPQDLILLEIAALQYSVGAIFLQRNGLFSRQGESFQVPISSMATQSSASCLKITFLFFFEIKKDSPNHLALRFPS